VDPGPVLEIKLIVTPTPNGSAELGATLTLLDPAVILDPPPGSVQDKLTGNSQTFTCEVGGTPAPTITFYHNGESLEDGDGVEINGGTLTISPTAEAHSGVYQCLADNPSGSASASWYLIVRDPIEPTITSTFSVDPDPCLGISYIQQDSPPIVLTVHVTADPCPTPTWTKDGGPIPTTGVTVEPADGCVSYSLGNKTFIFSLSIDVFSEETLGSYSLSLTNEGGTTVVQETKVTDRVRADITAIRTVPDSPIGDTDTGCLAAGGTVDIVCENVAFPRATVTFRKDGVEINTADERLAVNCDTLTITGVAPEDEGSYSCRVDNDDTEQSEDVIDPIKLDYCIVPSITSGLTFTSKNPQEGDETVASCGWTGSPDPMVTWYKNGTVLVEDEIPARIRMTVTTEGESQIGKLHFDAVELSDAGNYTCDVRNPVGSQSSGNSLEVRATPSQDEPGTPDGVGDRGTDGLAVGVSLGLLFIGLCILLSVLAILLFMWKVHKSKLNSSRDDGGTYVELNAVNRRSTERMEMTSNSAYAVKTSSDGDNTYDYIDDK
jgi:hypothetical protein